MTAMSTDADLEAIPVINREDTDDCLVCRDCYPEPLAGQIVRTACRKLTENWNIVFVWGREEINCLECKAIQFCPDCGADYWA